MAKNSTRSPRVTVRYSRHFEARCELKKTSCFVGLLKLRTGTRGRMLPRGAAFF